MNSPMDKLRLDKWLWAARFYKTRSLASDEIGRNRVKVNDQDAKPAREIRIGDRIHLRQGSGSDLVETTVIVRALSAARGPAPVARELYEETEESLRAREAARARRQVLREPAVSINDGRPTKRDRRQLADWNNRWTASLREEDS